MEPSQPAFTIPSQKHTIPLPLKCQSRWASPSKELNVVLGLHIFSKHGSSKHVKKCDFVKIVGMMRQNNSVLLQFFIPLQFNDETIRSRNKSFFRLTFER